MLGRRYRKNLRAAVAASAAPYGYTLATWTSGAMLVHARGIPDALAALAFMAGAVSGFAAVGALAFGGLAGPLGGGDDEEEPRLLWGSLHFLSVGLAIGAAALAARVVDGFAAWPLGGFVYTTAYLLGVGAESTFASVRGIRGSLRGKE